MFRTKIIRAETKTLGDGRVRAIVSTEAKDRDGDIIRQSGWVLDNFLANPLLLASHDYYSLRSVIGSWESMEVNSLRMEGVARYLVGQGNDEADWAYKLAENGLAAYSVGFIPKEFKQFKDGEGYGYEFTRQELLEVSHVSVPSNPQALQLMAKSQGLHPVIDSLVRELLAETKQAEGECVTLGCDEPTVATMFLCERHAQALMGAADTSPLVVSRLWQKADQATANTTLTWGQVSLPNIPVLRDQLHRHLLLGMATFAEELKAGRVMSQQNLNKLHSVIDAMRDIHDGVCDMGDDCPLEKQIGTVVFKSVPRDVSRDTAPEDTPWEAPTLGDFTDEQWGDLSDVQKRRIAGHFAWAASLPPETYGDLKLPHHRPNDGAVVWRGVAASMAVLMGGRGGVDVPAADRPAIYGHLVSHYEQFDREPPELRGQNETQGDAQGSPVTPSALALVLDGMEEAIRT